MSFAATYRSEAYASDNLIVGNAQLLLSEQVTLLAGQNLKRGALLGKVTASGKVVLSLAASSDGSQAPVAVLVDDTDATSGDKPTLIHTRGDFNAQAVTLGAGHTLASVKAGLEDRGIFLLNTQGGA